MTRSNRKPSPELLARAERARRAAEGPDRDDLIRQAEQARGDAPEQAILALKAAREAAGLSLRDLEAVIGISRGNLSRLENGSCNPTIATLRRYAQALGKTVKITMD